MTLALIYMRFLPPLARLIISIALQIVSAAADLRRLIARLGPSERRFIVGRVELAIFPELRIEET